MTRAEFIAVAADAILKAGGFDVTRDDLGLKRVPGSPESANVAMADHERSRAIEKAKAALDAVGAWETRSLLRDSYDLVVKPVADAYVTHGQRFWSLRDRVAEALGGEA